MIGTRQEAEGTNLSKGNQSQKPNEALKLQPIPDSLKLPGEFPSVPIPACSAVIMENWTTVAGCSATYDNTPSP
ncbi:hypothetical protein L2E82_31672 [Cichorium intybus]|uniref:Uncharacterized protein n=1 Tax=Cichorium intybus TaxID=13427 RepID=A0ACB9BEL1_CICIN|nr:hypothetical protein L2E82_31672 [Cichorium intybus]